MKEENIIFLKKLKLKNEKLIYSYLSEKFSFTVSETYEILEILYDFEKMKKLRINDIFETFEFNEKIDKKLLSRKFHLYIKELRCPKQNILNKKINKKINEIKNKNIKISIPKDFEGKGLTININTKSEEDLINEINRISKKTNTLKDIINLINQGG